MKRDCAHLRLSTGGSHSSRRLRLGRYVVHSRSGAQSASGFSSNGNVRHYEDDVGRRVDSGMNDVWALLPSHTLVAGLMTKTNQLIIINPLAKLQTWNESTFGSGCSSDGAAAADLDSGCARGCRIQPTVSNQCYLQRGPCSRLRRHRRPPDRQTTSGNPRPLARSATRLRCGADEVSSGTL
jgi:hypothetical protein